VPSPVLDAHVDFPDQQGSLGRRLEARHQKPVVPPGIRAGNRAAGVPTQSVGYQPFPAERLVPVAADIATKRQVRDLFNR
jgi:hypothetical protein